MNSYFAAVFFCSFVSLFLIISQHSIVVVRAAAQARNNGGVYIVYTGAAASSSTGFHSDHVLSSSSLESWKDRIIHRYDKAFSGFAARLSEEEAKSIAQRPEVVSVFPDSVLQLHTTRSWDFLKELSSVGFGPRQIPKSNSSDLSAQDVIIGIFDTGIWPEAKSFNDEGIGPIPNRWKGKCIEGPDFKPSNCNRKLIGARNYYTDDNSTSARDYNGHGTHVAAIAAGRSVPGASYRGLARGTARGGSPGSRIAVYRVCNALGCVASTVLRAFDDAIADGVDVISVSGGDFEYRFSTIDPVSIGAFHAVEKGIIVVGSAGDYGYNEDGPNIVNTAPWMLTVGAATIDRFFESDIVLGGNKMIKGGGVHSANFKKTPIYPLIDGTSAKSPDWDDFEARNCEPEALNAEKVKGKIVVCDTNDSEYLSIQSQLSVVTNLGGIGVLYIDYFGLEAATVSDSSPLIGISSGDAQKILSYINSTRNPVATILPTVANATFQPAPSLAYFSGYGPLFGNNYLIKPDVVAPGVGILSAWPSNETDEAFNLLSGTSMACPHVSGIAALVKSQYPTWSPFAIKSAIMTTANPNNNLKATITNSYGGEATPYEYGAGEVTLLGPLQPGLVYETEIHDYLIYHCYNGLNASQIRLLSSSIPANFSCPTKSSQELISNINYPSIAISLPDDRTAHQTVTRTVTNVGDEESLYRVSVEKTANMDIRVSLTELKFTKNQKKLSYRVTFRYVNASSHDFREHGSITWSNEKCNVRIPFLVS